MKEQTLYVCDICGTQYKEKKVCEACEKNHKKPKKIKGSRYLPAKDNALGYPISIQVEFDDGKIQTYKR